MIKIIEFASEPNVIRRKFWEENLKTEFEQIEFIESVCSKEELTKNYASLIKDVDGALVSEAYSKIFFEIYPQVSRRILEVKKIDCLIRDSGGIWPHCLMRESLHELIIQKANKLDTQMRAYVTGSESSMRVAISAAIQLGFAEICIVVDEVEVAQSILVDLQKTFFSVQFYILKNTDLTLQQNNGTLLVNTVRLEGKAEFIEDLTYLNFISLEGLVVDINLFPLVNPLIEESKHVGLRTLSGAELRGHMDWLFLKKIFGQVSVDAKTYVQKWLDVLKNKP